jgi:ribosomal protein L13E
MIRKPQIPKNHAVKLSRAIAAARLKDAGITVRKDAGLGAPKASQRRDFSSSFVKRLSRG